MGRHEISEIRLVVAFSALSIDTGDDEMENMTSFIGVFQIFRRVCRGLFHSIFRKFNYSAISVFMEGSPRTKSCLKV